MPAGAAARRPTTVGTLGSLVAHEVDVGARQRARGGSPARACSTRSMRSRRRSMRCEPVKVEQVLDDLRRAVCFAVDPPQLAPQRSPRRRGPARLRDQQLEVPEDALQRVVDLVRDAGDELAERRELLGLRELRRGAPPARLRAGSAA